MKSSEGERVENDTPPDASSLECYRIIRSQIEHENNVINQRLNWFVAAQSFLFTANAIVLNSPPTPLFPDFPETVRLLTMLIPIVAISCCLVIYATVIGALLALKNLRGAFRRQTGSETTGGLPAIHGRVGTRILGLVAPGLLPLAFLIVWVLLLVRAVRVHG